MLNRSLLLVRAKTPFLEWLRSLPDPVAESTTLEAIHDESTVYLVPAYEDDEEREDILRQAYDVVFEDQLASWWTDEGDWPSNRGLEIFQAWFETEWHSIVEDLVDGRLYDE